MKKCCVAAVVAVLAVPLAACGYTPEERATTGGAIGGATGAAVGAAAGGGVGGVLAGGLLGAATGAIIGASTPPPPPPQPYYYPAPPPCARWGHDVYGNPVCIAYYGY